MHEKMQCLSGAAVSLPALKDALCTETGARLHKLAAVTVFEVTKEGRCGSGTFMSKISGIVGA